MFTFPAQQSSHADSSLLRDKFHRKLKVFQVFHLVIYEFPAGSLLSFCFVLFCCLLEKSLACEKPAWLQSQPLFGILIYKCVPLLAVAVCNNNLKSMWSSRGADPRESPPYLHKLRWNQGNISLKTSMDHQIPTSTIYTSTVLAGSQEEVQQWMPSAVVLRNAFHKLWGIQFASLLAYMLMWNPFLSLG